MLGTQCVTALLLLGVPVGRVAGQTAAEATCRSLLDSSTAKVIVLPLPVDGPVPEVPPPAATEAMCDRLALHCGLGWLRLGDCLVFAVPVPFDLPVFDFEEPLPGHVAPHRIEAWRLLRGRPYAAVTEAWLSLRTGQPGGRSWTMIYCTTALLSGRRLGTSPHGSTCGPMRVTMANGASVPASGPGTSRIW